MGLLPHSIDPSCAIELVEFRSFRYGFREKRENNIPIKKPSILKKLGFRSFFFGILFNRNCLTDPILI
jgi:hypothetical protein